MLGAGWVWMAMLVKSFLNFVSKYKLVIFDFDGTLKDCAKIKTNAYFDLIPEATLKQRNRIVSHHSKNAGVSRYEKIPIYLKYCSISTDVLTVSRYVERYKKIVLRAVLEANWIPGAREFIQAPGALRSIYVVTATPQDEIRYILNEEGVANYFSGIYGYPDEKNDAVRKIIFDNRICRSNVLLIGDSLEDRRAAYSNQIDFLWRVDSQKLQYTQTTDPYITDFN